MHDSQCLKIEIHGLAAFAAFVAILRGEAVDLDKLSAALVGFKSSNDSVQQALSDSTTKP